eukprot:9258912-Pyramimonas_sp.AAC.1
MQGGREHLSAAGANGMQGGREHLSAAGANGMRGGGSICPQREPMACGEGASVRSGSQWYAGSECDHAPG